LLTGDGGPGSLSPPSRSVSERLRTRSRLMVTAALLAFVVGGVATARPPAEDRAAAIGAQIRCPVCSGESIAASPNQLAKDMMSLVNELIAQGYTDDQVIETVIAGYDDAQRLAPPFSAATAALWVVPGVVLVVGFAAGLSRRRALHP
jgi:cytochrome c-type biogenesis protein CcmH